MMQVGEPGPSGLHKLFYRLPNTWRASLEEHVAKAAHYTGRKQSSLGHPATIFDEDTFIVSYPRSGSTWLRFMITGLLWRGDVTYMNVRRIIPGIHTRSDRDLQFAPFPRLLKSHAEVNLRYPKVIYVVRDGRDVAVSYYHLRMRRGFAYRSFSDYLQKFLDGQIGSDGRWHEHVLGWMDRSTEIPFLLVRYEDLHAHTEQTLSSVADFLNIEHDSDLLTQAIHNGSFRNMRDQERRHYGLSANTDAQYETRKGGSGGWRSYYTDTDQEIFLDTAGDALKTSGYLLKIGYPA